MTKLIRILRFFFRIVGRLVLALLLLAVLFVAYLGFTASGARMVAERIAPLISSPDQIVSIETDSALLTGAVRAPEITLSDTKGVYARIRDLEVDWSPGALLGLTFQADAVRAGHVEYLRPPVKTETVDNTDRAPFRLPVAIDIRQAELPDIVVGQAVAGREFRLAASGSGRADNRDIVLSLSASRQDMPEARASAEIAYVPGENRLTLKASVDEPKDGMIAALLRLPDRPALHLNVDGAGPLSDWQGKLVAALDGAQAFSMDLQHQALPEDGHRVIVAGRGAAEPLMPETVRALFAGETAFAFDISLGKAGRIEITRGTLTSSSARLMASGVYDPAGQNSLVAQLSGAQGPVMLALPAGKGLARLAVRQVDLSLSGEASAAVLESRADIQSADYPDYRVEDAIVTASGTGLDLGARTGEVKTRLSFERGIFADPNLQRVLPGPFALSMPVALSPQKAVAEGATLESARLGGKISGEIDFLTGDIQSKLQLFAVPDILPDNLAERVKGQIALAASLTYASTGAITLSGLDLKTDILTAKGDVSLLAGQVKADLAGTLPSLGALLADAKGTAAFSLSAAGDLVAPAVKATLSSEKAVLSGRVLENLSVAAEGKADLKAPAARVEVEGRLGGQPVSIQGQVETRNGLIQLPVLEAQVGPNRIDGTIRLGSDYLPEGDLRFNLPDVGLVAALAGERASGDLKGTAVFARRDGAVSARIEASGKGVQRDGLSVSKPVVTLDVQDLKSLSATGDVAAAEIASGANRLTGLTLQFDRQGKTTLFDLKAGYDGKPLALKDAAALDGPRTTIRLDSFAATPKGVPLKLAKPTTITLEGGVATIADLVIGAGKGTVRLQGQAGSRLDLNADIKSLPLNLVNAVQPALQAEGTASGTVAIKGTAAAPDVTYRLVLDRAAVAQSRGAGLQAFGIKLDGTFRGGVVKLDATASNGDGLAIKGGGTAAVGGNRALALAFTGKVPLKAVSGLLASQGFVIAGTANLDVKIAGSAAQPSITGRITSGDASLVDVRRNLTLKNITVAIDLDRSKATISKLTGALSTGGTVSVTGSVGIQPGSGFPADLKIALNRAAYVDGKIVSTVLDGALTLTGPLTGNAKLGGNLALGRSAITIPQKLPASLAQINVQHKNESKAIAEQNRDVMSRTKGGGKGSSSSIALDLVVSAPRIFVQGRGIDAELGGDLTLRGTANDPVVSGGFKMRRGRLTILSRRLDFTSGTISFGGDLTPTLDMAAESDTGSTTVTVTISGPANDPAVSFSSSPALPQDEVLAQLIFNQSLSRLSVLQIAQLADAVAQLAGGRSTSLFQSLRSNLGVDDLDVTSDESGQAQVKAGKYLNDRTYIQVEQGANSGGKASINLDVGRGIKLKGEAGSNGAGAAGIFYEKEY